MLARIRRWRRNQRSHTLFVPVAAPGSAIVASGLCASRKLRLVEVRRGF